jgi:hypothetical protein
MPGSQHQLHLEEHLLECRTRFCAGCRAAVHGDPRTSPFNFVNNPLAGAPEATATCIHRSHQQRAGDWHGNFTGPFTVPYQTVLQILATTGGCEPDVRCHIAVTPPAVPETSSLTLLGLGFGFIGVSAQVTSQERLIARCVRNESRGIAQYPPDLCFIRENFIGVRLHIDYRRFGQETAVPPRSWRNFPVFY